ncbi:MAG: hypothetical protein NT047_01780 [Deltaproteobacteria bacterium]|nr:hypothetical protein [Deltaproteobacteria bacterium]
MPYNARIKQIAADFPGILERADLLNLQLIDLANKGFRKLVENFLSNRNGYTLRPFLFEIFICRWFLSINGATDIEYEPPDILPSPDFRFHLDGKLFHAEVKTLMQVLNETTKKKIISEINNRITPLTSNVIEIWLSDNLEQKEQNNAIDWISSRAAELRNGEKDSFMIGDDCYAWVRVLYVSKGEGSIGVEHIGGTHDGLLSEVNSDRIREQFRQKIKQANKQSPVSDDNIFNFVVMTYDFNILLSLDTLQQVLYGTEVFESAASGPFYERLSDDGIWSKRVFTNTDMLFVFESGTDMLENIFEPYVFPNPYNIQKLRTIPSPFNIMKCHVPSLYFSGPRKLN